MFKWEAGMRVTGSWLLMAAALIVASPAPSERGSGDRGSRHDATGTPAPLGDTGMAWGFRPLDDSDPEMRDLVSRLMMGSVSRNRVRGELENGGDRLARYMIWQFEASEREGYVSRTYLNLVGRTRSAAAHDYLKRRLEGRASLTRPQLSHTIEAISYLGDERTLAVLLPLFDESDNDDTRADVVRAVVEVMDRSGARPRRALEFLRQLSKDPHYSHYVTRELRRLGLEEG